MAVRLIPDPVFDLITTPAGRATFETQVCMHCGKTTLVLLDIGKVNRWRAGEHVQQVWPEMSAEARELLKTGTHPACWEAMFGGLEDEDDDEDEASDAFSRAFDDKEGNPDVYV